MALVTLQISGALTMKCPIYTCATDFSDEEGCFKVDLYSSGRLTFHLRSCEDSSKVCDITRNENVESICMPYFTDAFLYPGEYCRFDTECYSGNCLEDTKVCAGRNISEVCSTEEDCAAGLYCLEGTCQPTQKEGASCDKVHKCDSTHVCESGVCVRIGSRPAGEKAQLPGVCSTMYIYNGVCAGGPTLKEGINLTQDTEGGECVYVMPDGKSFSTEPVCGMTKDALSFCNPGLGEMNLNNVLFLLH
jgi:hypothetical protein